jgi:mannose-1-phosphate guanylyltransferase/mannose-6-phosphate isomerase
MITAFETMAPDNFKLTKDSVETAQSDPGFIRINPEPWSELEDISIDYGIMEKVKNY